MTPGDYQTGGWDEDAAENVAYMYDVPSKHGAAGKAYQQGRLGDVQTTL